MDLEMMQQTVSVKIQENVNSINAVGKEKEIWTRLISVKTLPPAVHTKETMSETRRLLVSAMMHPLAILTNAMVLLLVVINDSK